MSKAPRHAVTALLTAALAVTVLVTAPAPAAVANVYVPPCAVGTQVADRVTVDRASRPVPVTLQTTCVGLRRADVFLSRVEPLLYGYAAPVWSPATDGAVHLWEVDGDNFPGVYETSQFGGVPTDTELTSSYSRSTVKFGSKSGLTASRAGSQVTLTACSSYYNGRRDAYLPWVAHHIAIQQLAADGTWRFVRAVGTGPDGCGTYRLTSTKAGTFRATSHETYQVFSRTSPSVRV